jgi:hypothetical protein
MASSSDRNVYLELESPDELITTVLVHIRNNTIVIGNLTLDIPITLTVDTGETFDLTGMNSTFYTLSYPAHRVKLSAPYPFAVFEFSAFTNQNCSQNQTADVIIWGIGRNTVNETLVKYEQNITEANCPECEFYNYTVMSYLNYTFTIRDILINQTFLKTNPETCYLPYLCASGKCSHEPCVDYFNCKGNGYVFLFIRASQG